MKQPSSQKMMIYHGGRSPPDEPEWPWIKPFLRAPNLDQDVPVVNPWLVRGLTWILMVVHRRLLITGHVQGVWYRKSALVKGKELGLAGTARNLPSGAVEVHVEGDRDVVE